MTINYNPMQGKTPNLHLKHGKAYENSFVDAKVRGVIKDVIVGTPMKKFILQKRGFRNRNG